MKIANELGHCYEVFILSDQKAFVIVKNEDYSLTKCYDLWKYSIKYAIEDFVKFENLIKQKKQNNEK